MLRGIEISRARGRTIMKANGPAAFCRTEDYAVIPQERVDETA